MFDHTDRHSKSEETQRKATALIEMAAEVGSECGLCSLSPEAALARVEAEVDLAADQLFTESAVFEPRTREVDELENRLDTLLRSSQASQESSGDGSSMSSRRLNSERFFAVLTIVFLVTTGAILWHGWVSPMGMRKLVLAVLVAALLAMNASSLKQFGRRLLSIPGRIVACLRVRRLRKQLGRSRALLARSRKDDQYRSRWIQQTKASVSTTFTYFLLRAEVARDTHEVV